MACVPMTTSKLEGDMAAVDWDYSLLLQTLACVPAPHRNGAHRICWAGISPPGWSPVANTVPGTWQL